MTRPSAAPAAERTAARRTAIAAVLGRASWIALAMGAVEISSIGGGGVPPFAVLGVRFVLPLASKDEPWSSATGHCSGNRHHTVRSASTGASRAARRAGYRPATTPSMSAEARPPHTATGGTTTIQ